ncbi:hypothetical protein AB0L70_41320, partial [Kribbella sp. NPDC051952]|uniref:hypothetical protein n=1 Tax=Kribbella sp. NPDC051952 TaxID=3154851 RepID=UPI00341A5F8E
MSTFAIFVIIMIVLSVVGKLRQQSAKSSGKPNPRVQQVIDKIQAQVQQNGGPPLDLGPKYAQYAQPPAQRGQQQLSATAPTSQQVAATLQQVLTAGRQPRRLDERMPPGQSVPMQYQPAQVPYQAQYPPPVPWLPSNQPPQHRPPQNNLPAPNQDLDTRVRQLMNAKNEVGAIRLLCDERDLGILEAQKYARALITPAGTKTTAAGDSEPDEDDNRYVGSAAFAESIFDLDRDEDVWASGWVDTPEPEDRTDIDELWQ